MFSLSTTMEKALQDGLYRTKSYLKWCKFFTISLFWPEVQLRIVYNVATWQHSNFSLLVSIYSFYLFQNIANIYLLVLTIIWNLWYEFSHGDKAKMCICICICIITTQNPIRSLTGRVWHDMTSDFLVSIPEAEPSYLYGFMIHALRWVGPIETKRKIKPIL